MLEPRVHTRLRRSIRKTVMADRQVLDTLLDDVKPLRHTTKRIQPRRSTMLSIVATDGGNHGVEFDPFAIDIVRVIDSSNKQHSLETLTPNMPTGEIDAQHFDVAGHPKSSLGRMMAALNVHSISDISSSIAKAPENRTALWVTIYRELAEWAALLDLVQANHTTDTVIVFNSLLRSKKFASGLFKRYQSLLNEAIRTQFENHQRRIYIVGFAKKNKFLQQYRLAMAMQGIMRNTFPCYTPIPNDLQKKVYKWSEIVTGGGEGEGFNAGQLYLVKFGNHRHDPVWAVDILDTQRADAGTILGHLLFDAQEGFPTPYYPMSLQQARERAALAGLDIDILQDEMNKAVEECIGPRAGHILNELALQPTEPEATRY